MTEQRFDLVSPTFKRDPFPTFRAMREAGPVVRTKVPFIGQAWVPTTFEACDRVLRDSESFVRNAGNAGRRHPVVRWWMPKIVRVMTRNMLEQDEPDHRRLRMLVDQAFQRRSVDEMRPAITALANDLIDRLAERAAKGDGTVDWFEHFARPFPLAVICELLGIPEEDRAVFSKWANELTNLNSWFGMVRMMFGFGRRARYVEDLIRSVRETPRPGLLSALVEAEQDGDRLDDEELVAMTFLLLFAGLETTVHLINVGILALLAHPDQLARLAADWSRVETGVEEVLRWGTPIQFTKPRYAARDLDLFGTVVKQGEFVMPCIASANCDPAKFDDPETFDVFRDPNPHLGFGTGIHTCLGLRLARAEAGIALERLFSRYPNVTLGVPETELKWIKRIGTRGVTRLPLRLEP